MLEAPSFTNALLRFEQEFEKFLQDLKRNPKSKKKADFIGQIQLQNAKSTPDELQASVEQLMKTCADKRMRRWYAKSFWPVVNTLKDYTGVIDTMGISLVRIVVISLLTYAFLVVQAYPMPATLIWGGLKIVLEVSMYYSHLLEYINSGKSVRVVRWTAWPTIRQDKIQPGDAWGSSMGYITVRGSLWYLALWCQCCSTSDK